MIWTRSPGGRRGARRPRHDHVARPEWHPGCDIRQALGDPGWDEPARAGSSHRLHRRAARARRCKRCRPRCRSRDRAAWSRRRTWTRSCGDPIRRDRGSRYRSQPSRPARNPGRRLGALRPVLSRPMTTAISPSATTGRHRARPEKDFHPRAAATTVRGLFSHACTGEGCSGPFCAMPTTTRGSAGASSTARSRDRRRVGATGRRRTPRAGRCTGPSAFTLGVGVPRAFGRHDPGDAHQTTAVMPPSTKIVCPLTKADASLARNTSVPTRSSTRPQRPAGVRCATHAENSASSTSAWVSSVAK